jgi:hypothetical protein
MATEPTTTNLSPRKILQAWIERTFPGDVRPETALGSQRGIGYYAANAYGDHDRAELRYYNGGSQRDVEFQLQVAAAKLDERGATYTWQLGNSGYKYLLVSCYVEEPDDPEPEPKPDELSL